MSGATASLDRRNRRVALYAAIFVTAMVGLAFASVPLYRIFCEATGFDGTTGRAAKAPGAVAGSVGVRFDANIDARLPWKFGPEQERVVVRPGGKTIIYYSATNLTARTTTGQAVFNVTPTQAGKYFNKIACFCFTEQTLKPHQKVDMPVVFFVDPAMVDDPDADHVREITLSYTFYPVETDARGR